MRSKCRDIHQSSSLPSILDTYLSPAGVRKAENEDKAQQRRRRTVQHDCDPDQEAKARRQAQLEQRHLEAYMNLHRLRDALYERYAALLTEKVQSQRQELQRRYEAARAKSHNQTKQTPRKLAFSILQHNDSYLKSLPKTRHYLIWGLQKELAQRGCLKTHGDLEDFYRLINYNQSLSQLQKNLQDIKKKMTDSRSAADLMTEQKTCGSPRFPLTAEKTGHEDHFSCSRPPSQSSLLERGSGSGQSSAELLLSGSKEEEETEQMFPKMKVPTFVSLQPNFLGNLKSKIPQLIIPEIPEKSRKADIYLGWLRHMHDISIENMIFSQRLLDRERDSLCWQEERSVQDLVPCIFPSIDSKQKKTSQAYQTPLQPLKRPGSVQRDPPQVPQQRGKISSASCQCLETTDWDTAVCRSRTPDPLSMEDVCQQKHVEVKDCSHGNSFIKYSNSKSSFLSLV
ncbi:uncharacterized protein LOC115372950 [Myripristis murdjan]|uniref:uncharacterized protein LOC115372950 n=1 Tax=Myripristis murdjan TaxID=586833 RepID=UPI001175EC56|nr:uncharacterized protein LOC115372950 [Myripristis murdjan]